jgi:hypothetical protein
LYEYAAAHRAARLQNRDVVNTITHETPHPYLDDMNEVKTWHFPGAREIQITFDDRSDTDRGCDYLEIFAGPEVRNSDRIGKYTGSRKSRVSFL